MDSGTASRSERLIPISQASAQGNMNAWQIWLALSMAAFGMIGLTLPLKKAVSVTTSKFGHSKMTGLDGAGMKSGLACSPPQIAERSPSPHLRWVSSAQLDRADASTSRALAKLAASPGAVRATFCRSRQTGLRQRNPSFATGRLEGAPRLQWKTSGLSTFLRDG
jgi:hypothetical protein